MVDLVYRHGGTLLLNTAKANGAEVVDGLEILVAQGAASLERWTGRTAPDMAMREAVADIANELDFRQPPEAQARKRPHHAVASWRLRPRAHRRHRRPRVRRPRHDGPRDRARDRERLLGPSACWSRDGTLSDDQLARAVAERFGLDHIDLTLYRVDPDAAKLVAPAAVRRYQAVPVSFVGDRTLLVAMVDPANVLAIDDIAVMTGYEVRPAVAALADVERLLDRLEDPTSATAPSPPRSEDDERRRAARSRSSRPPPPTTSRENAPINFGAAGEDASVIQLVHRVIKEAVERGASDIHFEPGEDEMRIRYRIDGVLQEAATVPVSAVPAVISRIKILSDLDIAERRIPQDGRISIEVADKPIDLRVATLPATLRREGGHAHPRPEQGHDPARAAGHAAAGARALHQGVHARRTAPCSSPARPAPASRPRSTPRSTSSTRSRRTSSRSRTRSSTS